METRIYRKKVKKINYYYLTSLLICVLTILILLVKSPTQEHSLPYMDMDFNHEPSTYYEPVHVVDPPIENAHIQTAVYGNQTYIIRENNLYERDGKLWRPYQVTTTAYTWKDDGFNPSIGAGDGKTANGRDAIRTYGFATDNSVLPIGTTIHVAGYGTFNVDDTGGALRSAWRNRREIIIDIRIPQLRFDGQWRSIAVCQRIARNHGRQINRIVMVQID